MLTILLLLLFIVIAITTYLYLKPFIKKLLYSLSNEPKYIHSYVPFASFGLQMLTNPVEFIRSLYLKYGKVFEIQLASKRWVYFYDEQTYLTRVLKSTDFSIDEFLNDFIVNGLDVNRECLLDENIQQLTLKHYHQYLVRDELQILNKRAHDSLIGSMKRDAKTFQDNQSKISFTNDQRNTTSNFYKQFKQFDIAYGLCAFSVPFRSLLYTSILKNRAEFVQRFSSIKLNNGELQLIHAREELRRSDKYKHLFREYDIGTLQGSLLWAAVANTAPAACWIIVNLLLHTEAFEAVKQELNETLQSLSTSIYDKETLDRLKILESCITEAIRRVIYSVSQCQAIRDTSIECVDKTTIKLRKSDMLIYPAFLKHFDPNLFGPNPHGYQYNRFIKKKQSTKITVGYVIWLWNSHVSRQIFANE
ncbi:unnamed protein product [Rotaria sp. Silwood2]|nr:unnamed protein product [Rotaria sp. Silwood2]CAF4459660.1 unnamed protein product [Rotaria sp. Silwood2]